MRFYRTTDEATEVVWYPVPDDRPFVPFTNAFTSWEWVEPNRPSDRVPGGVELGEQIDSPRIFPGRPLPRRTRFNNTICGGAEEWANGDGLPVVPPDLYADGFPQCCGRVSIPIWLLNSCPDLYKMARCLRLQYNGNVVVKNYVESLFDPGVWEWPFDQDNGGTLPPGMLIGVNEDWALVVVSGTTHFAQYLQQALGSIAPGGRATPNGNAFATSNIYYDSAVLIRNRVRQHVPEGHPVLIIGHSYGGAIAQIGAVLLADSPEEWTVYVATFGAPRAGDQRLRTLIAQSVEGMVNVVNDGDPVPRFPLWPNAVIQAAFPLVPWHVWTFWRDSPYRQGLRVDGTMYANPSSYVSEGMYVYILTNLALLRFNLAFADHDSAEYERRLGLNNCGGVPVAFPVPILWLRPEELEAVGVGNVIDQWVDFSPSNQQVLRQTAPLVCNPVVGPGLDGHIACLMPSPGDTGINQFLINPMVDTTTEQSTYIATLCPTGAPPLGRGPVLLNQIGVRPGLITPVGQFTHNFFTVGLQPRIGVWWCRLGDGTMDAGTSEGLTFSEADTGYPAPITAEQLRFVPGATPFSIMYQEVIVFPRKLTDVEHDMVMLYLREKYPSTWPPH